MRNQKRYFRFLSAHVPVVLALLLSPSMSQAALNAYMTMECDTQGTIIGGVTQAGREGQILVHAFGHNISSPRDAASGLPTGKRQHRPIRILKPVDKATPLINVALFNNENCNEVIIRLWRPSPSGTEEQYYTITLINAQVVSVMPTMADNRVPENMQFPVWEVVSLTYQKIILTYEDGGITAEDDWEAPVL